MTRSKVLLTAAAVILAASFNTQAMNKREHHATVYEAGCDTCHDQGMGKFPSDEACLQCHDVDDVAEMTAREGDEVKQNPHNSMHYGKEAPCQECHGEHTPKKALCQECHNFSYPKFK
ncbi:Cytochrome c3 [Ferrimonas sediminum]|uniref:Cytochrome c3 n=1 Tax=Ferrimonas sediminum TaxID=718193 RepID=A0A1G8JIX3_9GAMM|nr:cytochrome c3 family protein [Ferrimonas sediminum]SDI31239.1 Cytochrome c3 [Ferrimonas sediminum]